MVEYYSVSSYEQFLQHFTRLNETQNRILALFCGDLDSTGNSWCPDCRNAMPVIHSVMHNNTMQNVPLGYIFVGIERNDWKNVDNHYRTDRNLRIKNVPTLICWEKGREVARLVDQECGVPELVEPFFKSKSL